MYQSHRSDLIVELIHCDSLVKMTRNFGWFYASGEMKILANPIDMSGGFHFNAYCVSHHEVRRVI